MQDSRSVMLRLAAAISAFLNHEPMKAVQRTPDQAWNGHGVSRRRGHGSHKQNARNAAKAQRRRIAMRRRGQP